MKLNWAIPPNGKRKIAELERALEAKEYEITEAMKAFGGAKPLHSTELTCRAYNASAVECRLSSVERERDELRASLCDRADVESLNWNEQLELRALHALAAWSAEYGIMPAKRVIEICGTRMKAVEKHPSLLGVSRVVAEAEGAERLAYALGLELR